MIPKIIKLFARSVGLFIMSPLVSILKQSNISELQSIIIAGIIALMLILVVEFLLLRLPLRFYWFRKQYYPIAKFEGCWIQSLNITERPHSISWVKYNDDSRSYSYYGFAFDKNGEPVAHWTADSLVYNSEHGFYFHGTGYLQQAESLNPVENWGYIRFYPANVKHDNNFLFGSGFSFDIGDKASKSSVELYKVGDDKINELIKKNEFRTKMDFSNFIMEYMDKIKYNKTSKT